MTSDAGAGWSAGWPIHEHVDPRGDHHELLLQTLQRGEVISEDVDIEAEIERIEAGKLDNLDLQAAGGQEPQSEEGNSGANDESGDSQVRDEVVKRLRRLAQDNRNGEGSN